MKHAFYCVSDLLDHALTENYNIMKINDPLIFVNIAKDWDAFTPLLNDLYHNDTENGCIPNIPVKIMVKVLFLQSMYNMVDEQAETLIRDRVSFMNFLDYPDQYPDARTIWLFRERLSKTGRDRIIWNELQRHMDSKGIKVKKGYLFFLKTANTDPITATAATILIIKYRTVFDIPDWGGDLLIGVNVIAVPFA